METVLREKNMLLALEMLELYTELISVRIR